MPDSIVPANNGQSKKPTRRRFSEARNDFDETLGRGQVLSRSLVPVDGKERFNIPLRGTGNEPLEEYYKWQFIHSIIQSGLYPRDHVGAELRFPKGSKGARDLHVDGAIFDSSEWIERYNIYWRDEKPDELQWLNDHLLAVIEFKRKDHDVEYAFTHQLKPAMREKEPSDCYVLGVYYDNQRLFLFHRRNGRYLRYDETKNQKGDDSKTGDLSLFIPDPYQYIPSFDELRNLVNKPQKLDRSKRTIQDLDTITSISTPQMKDALSNVLRTLDKAGLANQKGYDVLIQTLAMKIFDEKRNQRNQKKFLEFYITEKERTFPDLSDESIQNFIKRIRGINEEARGQYQAILQRNPIAWNDIDQVRAIVSVCENFQDYSFARSSNSDLYQLVFYNFATKFQQQEKAQFLTPLSVIDFLVRIVNPHGGETLFDPCCGIADFLSQSYVNSRIYAKPMWMDDSNIYGADISQDMITLAYLNMLLNGDGNAKLFHVPDKGSIAWKVREGNPPTKVELLPSRHKNGNWDDWPDKTRLMKFDVILTNPPFGEDRAFRPQTSYERQLMETYEVWPLSGNSGKIDLGVIFLENAYRSLKEEGRLGIVLSNSIASINRWQNVRTWLMDRMRIVALFDLPANVFAETGVNTTLLVAYKPKEEELRRLNAGNYSVFVRDIKNVGYEKRTSKRNVFFKNIYRINEDDFEVLTEAEGRPILDEDFTDTVHEFRNWALGQENTLQRLFLGGCNA